MSFTELLNSNCELPAFSLPEGTVTDNLRAKFWKFLAENELGKDPQTSQNCALYSLRHTDATFALTLSRTDIHLLAKQMGTCFAKTGRHYSCVITKMRAENLAGLAHGVYERLDGLTLL